MAFKAIVTYCFRKRLHEHLLAHCLHMFEVEITTSNLKKSYCRLTKAQKASPHEHCFSSRLPFASGSHQCHVVTFGFATTMEFLPSAIHSHPSTLLPACQGRQGHSYIRVKNAGRTHRFRVKVACCLYNLHIWIWILYTYQYRPVMCIRDPAKKKWVAHLFHLVLVWSGWSKPTLLGFQAESFNNR